MTRRTGELLFDKLRPMPVDETRPASVSDSPIEMDLGYRPVVPPRASRPPEPLGSQTPHPTPSIKIEGAKLTFSLSSSNAAVGLFLLLLLFAGTFYAGHSLGHEKGRETGFKEGRDSYSADTTDEISRARASVPQHDVVEGLLRDESTSKAGLDPAKGSKPQPGARSIPVSSKANEAAVAWIEGHNYIVVQEFEAGAATDADQARDFLLQEGIPTVVVRTKNGRVNLITLEGFNFKEAAQRRRADLLKQRIGEVGEKYFAGGGRYKLQGYYAAFKGGW